jgi:hypothetical protein
VTNPSLEWVFPVVAGRELFAVNGAALGKGTALVAASEELQLTPGCSL